MLTRRQFLKGLAGGAALGAGTVGYGMKIESKWLDVEEKHVPLPSYVKPARPIRIAHLSDLHACEWAPTAYLHHAAELALAANPDLICLTGDYLTCGEFTNDGGLIYVLQTLTDRVPTFATLGNHDGGPFTQYYSGERTLDRIGRIFEKGRVTWLQNRTVDLRVQDHPVRLTGLGDLWNDACRPEEAFVSFPTAPDTIRIAMSHNPDSKEVLLPYPWHLMLSGHTHGGQCGIPGIRERLAPVHDKRFIAGLYPLEDRQLHITRGVGNLHGIRILCRPEVSLLVLG